MDMTFSAEFTKVFDLIEKEDEDVFITGSAGTGKSTFLTYLVNRSNKDLVVLAPTGVAAVNVGGQTIHSFFRFKPGVTLKEAKKSALNYKFYDKTNLFEKLDLIIIDEISMVRADLLDSINIFLQTILNSEKPFGGKQMVFIGDLYQLPPVVTKFEKDFLKAYKSPYFFDSKIMNDFNFSLITFDEIYRQKDEEFIRLLNDIRTNEISHSDIEKINERYVEKIDNDKDFIYLTCTNHGSKKINEEKLSNIFEKTHLFKGELSGKFDLKSSPVEESLKLKKGVQVMFVANDAEKKWVNGSIGTVKSIVRDNIKVQLDSGEDVWVTKHKWQSFKYEFDEKDDSIVKKATGSFLQYPLKLAWAITIHKSQGKTFNKTIIDIENGTFAHGQMYVALSRNTSFEGMILKKKIKKKDILMDETVKDFLNKNQ